MIDLLVKNYGVILLALVLVVAAALFVIWFIKLPATEKESKIRSWLKWAVIEAEKELGRGTGQAKLVYAWNLFTKSKFGWMTAFITYSMFENWINSALKWLNVQLDTNENLFKYIYGADASQIRKGA